MKSKSALKYGVAFASFLVAPLAMAESGTYETITSLVHAYTSIDHNGDTVTGGSSRGTSTVTTSSGGLFSAGASSAFECVVFARKSSGGMDLEAPCASTDSSGDKIYSVAKRKAGEVSEGGGGAGTSAIVGGTGRYAGMNGNCNYTVSFLPNNRLVSISKCRWQK